MIIRELLDHKKVLLGNAYWPMASIDLVGLNIETKRPKIITLGNSRVLQFRDVFFKQADFVNAGGTIGKVEDLNDFFEKLPTDYRPQVIIIGLEQSYFNPATADEIQDNDSKTTSQSKMQIYLSVWPKIYKDYFLGKFRVADLFTKKNESKAFGLNALVNHNGLRNDGSYYYGKFIKNPQDVKAEDYGFKDTNFRIRKNCCRFERSSELSKKALFELELFLEKCFRKGIYVTGFLPPYPHEIYRKITSMNDDYLYLRKLMPALSPIFGKHNFSLFDFSDLNSTGAAEGEYIDGLHASEKAYLRLWIKMAESDKVLIDYADLPELKQKLSEAKSDYEVFSPNE